MHPSELPRPLAGLGIRSSFATTAKVDLITEFAMKILKSREELLTILPQNSIGAEIGVMDGEFSSQILSTVRPKRLYLVDNWKHSMILCRKNEAGDWIPREFLPEDSWAKVKSRFELQIDSGTLQVVCADSIAWLDSLPAATLDWVYLDDDHSYEHLKLELCVSSIAVRAGGWILGHDYCDVFPGVKKAVDEFCQLYSLNVDYMTDQEPEPVFPRWDHMPEWCAYNSFAICCNSTKASGSDLGN